MNCKKKSSIAAGIHKERPPSPQQLTTYSKHCHKTWHELAISSHTDTVAAAASRERGKTKSIAWDSRLWDRQGLETTSCNLPLPKQCTLLRRIITGNAVTYTKVIFAHTSWYSLLSNQGGFQKTMYLTSVCLKASKELYLTQNLQLRKGETNNFSHFSFLFQVALAPEGWITISRGCSLCVTVQSSPPQPSSCPSLSHAQAGGIKGEELTHRIVWSYLWSLSSHPSLTSSFPFRKKKKKLERWYFNHRYRILNFDLQKSLERLNQV